MIENPGGTAAPSNSIMDSGMVGESIGKLVVAGAGEGVAVEIPGVGVEFEGFVPIGVDVDGWHATSKMIKDMIQPFRFI